MHVCPAFVGFASHDQARPADAVAELPLGHTLPSEYLSDSAKGSRVSAISRFLFVLICHAHYAGSADYFEAESQRRLEFTADAVAQPFPEKCPASRVDAAAAAEISWISQRSCAEVRQHRESVCVELESLASRFRRDGLCETWFQGCDEHVREVAGDFNGPLAEHCAAITDCSCARVHLWLMSYRFLALLRLSCRFQPPRL